MNIIWIDGGLGNQMFQYALAFKQESLGRQVKIDVTKYAEHHVHNDFELDRVFGIECSYATIQEIKSLGYRKENHLTNFLKKTPLCKKTFYSNESYVFDENVLKLDGYYLEGFWQSERYFYDIKDQIMKIYTFPEFDNAAQRNYAEQIERDCSISLHVRRGDYLNYSYLQGICTPYYYEQAMRYFRDRYSGQARFYIFSNDIKWAKDNFSEADCVIVEGNNGKDSFRDMQLMSLCKHNIVANSSFSWWGAWLNKHEGKIVIAPDRWINQDVEEKIDVIPDDWIRISGSKKED